MWCLPSSNSGALDEKPGALEETLEVTSEGNRVIPFKNERAPSPKPTGWATAGYIKIRKF